MLIDSHCHWDAAEFAGQGSEGMRAAQRQGVGAFVLPGVEKSNWPTVTELAHSVSNGFYTLGIHPCYVMRADQEDLTLLRRAVELALADQRFIGVGEIGLDYFVSGLDVQRQWLFFTEQLRIARDFALPVVCHVRRSQDKVLQGLRQFSVKRGIAHAFNGSHQQAKRFVDQGLCLGFGGAMTFTRALQIRRLAADLPLSSLVLETDAPDISPEWIAHQTNDSSQLPRIAQVLAQLRSESVHTIASATTSNVLRQFERMKIATEPKPVSKPNPLH
jgi:TatD DNase family protein